LKRYTQIIEKQSFQYLIGIGIIFLVSFICYLFIEIIGYHVVALILLLTVSILAMFFEIWPIVTVAVLSALIWNFFFIQPRSTLSINTPEDALLFLMYFVIAVMNAVFTTKIRKAEASAQKRKEKEKTLQLYTTLFNSLSHELKTPISTIIGSIDALKANAEKFSPTNRQELYSEIEIAGHRLNRQVGNLLNMSRLESNFVNLQRDWYDLNELIFSVIDNNVSQAANHRIIFEAEEELPLFKLDAVMMEQILQNILHNSLQYTPSGSVIEIEAFSNDMGCVVVIRDNGKGFPTDKLNKVFEKFYRLPNTATGGTGLGLSIAQGFANAQNGTIELKNINTGGAEFTIKIPAEITHPNIYRNE
jgi:two-component system, OmpR family, sensor histidine kinase KdpD